MKILYTDLYDTQLKSILEELSNIDLITTQRFKTYLDTIIINIPTKFAKYKQSAHFDNQNIREVMHENYIIFFYKEDNAETFLILAIVKNN